MRSVESGVPLTVKCKVKQGVKVWAISYRPFVETSRNENVVSVLWSRLLGHGRATEDNKIGLNEASKASIHPQPRNKDHGGMATGRQSLLREIYTRQLRSYLACCEKKSQTSFLFAFSSDVGARHTYMIEHAREPSKEASCAATFACASPINFACATTSKRRRVRFDVGSRSTRQHK